jgi:hypothetical protein
MTARPSFVSAKSYIGADFGLTFIGMSKNSIWQGEDIMSVINKTILQAICNTAFVQSSHSTGQLRQHLCKT